MHLTFLRRHPHPTRTRTCCSCSCNCRTARVEVGPRVVVPQPAFVARGVRTRVYARPAQRKVHLVRASRHRHLAPPPVGGSSSSSGSGRSSSARLHGSQLQLAARQLPAAKSTCMWVSPSMLQAWRGHVTRKYFQTNIPIILVIPKDCTPSQRLTVSQCQ